MPKPITDFMTDREIHIVKALLACLHNLDSIPVVETILHAAVNERLQSQGKGDASMNEVKDAIKHADAEGWIIGKPSVASGKMKWSISDKGESALTQL